MKNWILIVLIIISGAISAQTMPEVSIHADANKENPLRDILFPHWETADKAMYIGWGVGAMKDMLDVASIKELLKIDNLDMVANVDAASLKELLKRNDLDMVADVEFKYNRMWFGLGLGYSNVEYEWRTKDGKIGEKYFAQYVNLRPTFKYSIISSGNFQLALGLELWMTRNLRCSHYTNNSLYSENLLSYRHWLGWSVLMPIELYYSVNPACTLFLGFDAGMCLRPTTRPPSFDYDYPHIIRLGVKCKVK